MFGPIKSYYETDDLISKSGEDNRGRLCFRYAGDKQVVFQVIGALMNNALLDFDTVKQFHKDLGDLINEVESDASGNIETNREHGSEEETTPRVPDIQRTNDI